MANHAKKSPTVVKSNARIFFTAKKISQHRLVIAKKDDKGGLIAVFGN
ncbi:hypothetical protein ACLK18_02345 [Escherichia coli]